MSFPDSFSTARLDARRLTTGDWDEICRMHSDPVVMAHLGGVRDDLQTAEYFAVNLQHWAEHNFGLWIVHERGQSAPMGRALLRHAWIDGVDEVEVGYALYPAYWGRGFATEIAAECVRLGFEALRLSSIVAITSPDNLASQHVLEKVGLARERDFVFRGAPAVLFRIRRPQAVAG
jgi:RimJ/RimL family protein N-acetyltransferase